MKIFNKYFCMKFIIEKKNVFQRDTFFITMINFLLMRYFPNLLTCFSSTTTDNHVDFYLLIALTTIHSLVDFFNNFILEHSFCLTEDYLLAVIFYFLLI